MDFNENFDYQLNSYIDRLPLPLPVEVDAEGQLKLCTCQDGKLWTHVQFLQCKSVSDLQLGGRARNSKSGCSYEGRSTQR